MTALLSALVLLALALTGRRPRLVRVRGAGVRLVLPPPQQQ